jgi:hypothetical protein
LQECVRFANGYEYYDSDTHSVVSVPGNPEAKSSPGYAAAFDFLTNHADKLAEVSLLASVIDGQVPSKTRQALGLLRFGGGVAISATAAGTRIGAAMFMVGIDQSAAGVREAITGLQAESELYKFVESACVAGGYSGCATKAGLAEFAVVAWAGVAGAVADAAAVGISANEARLVIRNAGGQKGWLEAVDIEANRIAALTGLERQAAIDALWTSSHPMMRGAVLESLAAQGEYVGWKWVGRGNGGYYPTIDFVQDGVAVSYKTLDYGNVTYKWMEALERNIDQLAKRAFEKDFGPMTEVRLDLRIPVGRNLSNSERATLLERAADKGIVLSINGVRQ